MSLTIVAPKHIRTLEEVNLKTRVLPPFSDILIDFVAQVSQSILKDPLFKQYPELIALAFWMRRSHILQLKKNFLDEQKEKVWLGRGVVFHLAPSNVDTIFVYSWFLSLLVGNSNIIRISDRENIQMELLLQVIVNVLQQAHFDEISHRTLIVRYGHQDDITTRLSSWADVRVIWGGDDTVKHIRSIPIKPTATELTFADKFSFALIKSDHLLKNQTLDTLIEKFYNDAFWFGQMACSSIRLIVWVGDHETNQKAQELFWEKLEHYIRSNAPDDIGAADIVNKLVAEQSMAIESTVSIATSPSPYVNRIRIEDFNQIQENLHCGTGLFYELETQNVHTLIQKTTRKHQTVAYYGFKKQELTEMVTNGLPSGIDRIVPIGQALDFSFVWDGFDLFRSFSREIEILSQGHS
jgi:hypothetical protein